MKTEIRNSKLLRKENNAIIESCYVSAKDSHDKGNISTSKNAYFHRCTVHGFFSKCIKSKLFIDSEGS